MSENINEIGNDAQLWANGQSFPITSMSYTEEADVSDVQFNTGLNPELVTTGVSYSGSFEHSGGNSNLRDALYTVENGIEVPNDNVSITYKDDTHRYRFKGCICETREKEMPADDRTSVTYDFVAYELRVSKL